MKVSGHRRSVLNWGFKRRIKVIESVFNGLCRLLVFWLSYQSLLLPLTRYDLSVCTPTVFLFGVSLHVRLWESANLPTQSEVCCSSRSNWAMTTFLKRMFSKVWRGSSCLSLGPLLFLLGSFSRSEHEVGSLLGRKKQDYISWCCLFNCFLLWDVKMDCGWLLFLLKLW